MFTRLRRDVRHRGWRRLGANCFANPSLFFECYRGYLGLPFRRRGLTGASVMAVGAQLWLVLFLVSSCSPMLLVALGFGLSDAVHCNFSAPPVCVGCFLLFGPC